MRKTLPFLLYALLPIHSFANDIWTQNVVNGCNIDNLLSEDNEAYMLAAWQPNSYTCDPGYFLPANGIECVKCLVDHTCNGGTYEFNEKINQGIILNIVITTDFIGGCVNDILFPTNNNSGMTAIWEPNSYDCSGGYYLPADGIECAICPENSYCPGGTYTYSENITQGIMECPSGTASHAGAFGIDQCSCPANTYMNNSECNACPTGLVSPMGSVDIGACGRMLHIGNETLYLRSQKKTTPSLNFDVNHDGIPDFFGNATTQRTTINNTSQRYLHVGEYYIYDDSIRPEQ